MFVLIPLKVDVATYRTPFVNVALIIAIVVISIMAFSDEALLMKLGGIEVTHVDIFEIDVRLTTKDFPLPVLALTSTLVHAGWLHLLGNMLFLWVFGNAVNYKFGHVKYLVLYALAGMAGGLAHYATSDMPGIGASGAINGVMGAFLVFFPRNDVTVLWFWFLPFRPRISRISSIWIIVFWLMWDVMFLALGAVTGVALWAHVAGFIAGFSIALLCAVKGWIKSPDDEQTLLQLFGR